MSAATKKSPGSAAFDIYITNASDKGESTENWLANYSVIYIFYAAQCTI